jgi:hypothetical protein
VKPVTHLIGRAEDGSYRTSAAKEYPPGMNRSFAESFWLRIQHRFQQHGSSVCTEEVPVLAQELAQISASVDHGKQIMPDYQPV